HEPLRHVVQRSVGEDHRVFEQAVGVNIFMWQSHGSNIATSPLFGPPPSRSETTLTAGPLRARSRCDRWTTACGMCPLCRCAHRCGSRSGRADRKSTRLNSSHVSISYAVFCL